VHGNTYIRSLEGRCVIYTVSGHSSFIPKFPQAFYDQVLVLGEHLGGEGVVIREEERMGQRWANVKIKVSISMYKQPGQVAGACTMKCF
jgi:hypothetical protein